MKWQEGFGRVAENWQMSYVTVFFSLHITVFFYYLNHGIQWN
jgi:hypothetical protein